MLYEYVVSNMNELASDSSGFRTDDRRSHEVDETSFCQAQINRSATALRALVAQVRYMKRWGICHAYGDEKGMKMSKEWDVSNRRCQAVGLR